MRRRQQLDGIKGEKGVLHRIEAAGEVLDKIDSKLVSASQLSKQIESLPERLLKPADEMQFLAVMQESIAAALGGAIEDARQAATSAGLAVARDDLKAAADEILGDPVALRAELEAEKLMLVEVRKVLAERDGALQHSRDVFLDETESLAGIYTARGNALAETFDEKTTTAVNKIEAQNTWLPVKYMLLTMIGFVFGHSTHDWLYTTIVKAWH